MTARPILFSGPMVLALLEGRKTQTRRVIKFKPWHQIEERDDGKPWPWMYDDDNSADYWVPCPYGQPGDLLWVRETFMPMPHLNAKAFYRASDRLVGGHWSSPIHMPRALSRLTLRITDVRVHQLQDMEGQHASESEAIAEGVTAIHHGDGDYYYSAFRDEPHPSNWSDPTDAFRELWETINGPGSWDANPWVWALTFEVIKANVEQVQP